MSEKEKKKKFRELLHNAKASAIPVTFLILFVSLMLIITATYYSAITQISARGRSLNFSAAKQSMAALAESIQRVMWSPGASQIYYFDDFGGNLKTIPMANTLTLNITDDTFYDIVFNSSIGTVNYELSYAEAGASGTFLKGDNRIIINSSTASIAQLRITTGVNTQEIALSYRPFASSTVTDSSGEKPVNNVRIYVVNINISDSLYLPSGFYLKIHCANVSSFMKSYNFSYPISSIQINAVLNSSNGKVCLPIRSNAFGAIVNLEILICNVQLRRVGG